MSGAEERATDIAVIGMAVRLPGASTLEEFWSNLASGVESITLLERDSVSGDHVAAVGVIDNADMFDAAYFGFSPREALLLDPQQRVFLECANDALENAGCDPGRTASEARQNRPFHTSGV